MGRYISLLLGIFFPLIVLHAQKRYGLGSLDDDEAYAETPMMATRTTRDYVSIPERYSLRKYCPTPKSQGHYGTCVGWATAYAARSIAENIYHNWTDKNTKDEESFSPSFMYTLIKKENDLNCTEGASSIKAMKALKSIGAIKFNQFNRDCADNISTSLQQKASHILISILFQYYQILRDFLRSHHHV